jgi:hypothetical protein
VKSRRRQGRFGVLAFVVPILVVSAVVVYGVIAAGSSGTGKLIVEAQSSSTYYHIEILHVKVGVSGEPAGETPYNLSIHTGTYTVTFYQVPWFTTPASKAVNVTGGKTSYVVGTYDPVVVFVSVGGGEFNVTSASAFHDVTPLTLVNPSDQYVSIRSALTGTIIIPPLQTYTYVFSAPGAYGFSFLSSPAGNSTNLTVEVS